MWKAPATCIVRRAFPALVVLAALVAIIQAPAAQAVVPSRPSAVTVTQATTTSLSLGWQPVYKSSGYDVYLNGSRVAKTRSLGYIFGNLLCGTSYTLGVDAFDWNGRRSPITSVVGRTNSCPGVTNTDTAPPTPPSN